MLSAGDIERELTRNSIAAVGDRLLEIALSRGAIDNVSIVIVHAD
jgi:hypothetical protein